MTLVAKLSSCISSCGPNNTTLMSRNKTGSRRNLVTRKWSVALMQPFWCSVRKFKFFSLFHQEAPIKTEKHLSLLVKSYSGGKYLKLTLTLRVNDDVTMLAMKINSGSIFRKPLLTCASFFFMCDNLHALAASAQRLTSSVEQLCQVNVQELPLV